MTRSGRRALAALVVGLALVLARWWVFDLVVVSADTMQPGLGRGDLLLLSRLSAPQVGDVVLFGLTGDQDRYLGRVVAGPGEAVEVIDGRVRVDGRALATGRSRRAVVRWRCVPASVRVEEEARGDRRWEVVADQRSVARGRVARDAWWILADHRPGGRDSRDWGAVEDVLVTGVVVGRLWRGAPCSRPLPSAPRLR